MQENIPAEEQEGIEPFIRKSIELCWLMAIQEPSVYVDTNVSLTNTPFETFFLKPYTVQGQYVDFIVWPALYLQEGGSILSKGVAQGKTSRTPNNKWYDNVKIPRSQSNLSSLTPKSSSKLDTKDPVNERSATRKYQPESDKNGKHTETSVGNAASCFKLTNGERATDYTNPDSNATRKLTDASADSVLRRKESSETNATKFKQTGMSRRRASSFTKNITSNTVQEKKDSVS